MTSSSDITDSDIEDNHPLSEKELQRIRSELRYAALVIGEFNDLKPVESKSKVRQVFEFLSNGFILLVIGSLITSLLVPEFQRQHESRIQRTELIKESFSQFLLYSNSIWQEYYSILPLTQKLEIDEITYIEYLGKMTKIKLARYDAYAKLQSLAVVFRKDNRNEISEIEASIKQYAIKMNIASTRIDKYLTGLYCTPTERPDSPCVTFDPGFDGFSEFEKIKEYVIALGNTETERVGTYIIGSINHDRE